MEVNDWFGKEEDSTISLEEMDKLVVSYKEKREHYEEIKKEASDAYKEVEEVQFMLMQALEKARKKSYKVDGVGTFSVVEKQSVKIPQSLDKKRELVEYIKATYGSDVVDSMMSIHHGTLNSFYNQEVEKHKEDPSFHIPGLEAPTVTKEPRFLRAK